jgi:hypothetical protein
VPVEVIFQDVDKHLGAGIGFGLGLLQSIIAALRNRVATNVAVGLDDECELLNKALGENLGYAAPATWWIDGE